MEKMRHCWNCGAEMGLIASKFYEPTDTCGRAECEHAAAECQRAEREEAHERLDGDMGF